MQALFETAAPCRCRNAYDSGDLTPRFGFSQAVDDGLAGCLGQLVAVEEFAVDGGPETEFGHGLRNPQHPQQMREERRLADERRDLARLTPVGERDRLDCDARALRRLKQTGMET